MAVAATHRVPGWLHLWKL